MALKLTKFDAAVHFETPEAQSRLVNDALASGHPGYIANALGIVARARGMSALAKETGIARQALYTALREDGNPTLDTLVKVTTALGIELHATPKAPESAPAKSAAKGGKAGRRELANA